MIRKLLLFIGISFLLLSCALAADKKITELTEDASPTTDDLLITVNDPAGTPANRKVTIANFIAAITGLDISNSTNLAVTAPIVLTDDTLSCSNATESAKGCMQVSTGLDVSAGAVSVDITELSLTSAYIWVGGSGNTATAVDPAGDVEISNAGATSIGSDKVTEAMLKAVNSATDEDIFTYESTTGDFEWHTSAELSLVTGPASSVDNALARFNSTTGKIIQDYTSGAPTCGDTGQCTFANGVIISGGMFDQTDIIAFTANDATPSVSAGNLFKTANTEGTIITAFHSASNGQHFTVLIDDAYTTVDCSSSSVVCNNGVDWSPTSGNWLECTYDGTYSYCGTFPISSGGDVASSGDCTSGACGDGTSDGGRYYCFYDGDSNKTCLYPSDSSADLSFYMPASAIVAGDVLVGISANHVGVITKGDSNTVFGVNDSDVLGFYSSIAVSSYEVDPLPIGWAIDGTTAPGTLSTLTSTNKAKYRDFSGSADNDVFFEWQVPYGINAAVAPTFQVEGWVTNSTAPANTETIKFSLACASIAHSELLSSTLGSAVTVTFTADATLVQYDRVITGYSTGVTITGLAAGETVICKLTRDVTDTYAQSFGVGWLKIKYAKTTQGS